MEVAGSQDLGYENRRGGEGGGYFLIGRIQLPTTTVVWATVFLLVNACENDDYLIGRKYSSVVRLYPNYWRHTFFSICCCGMPLKIFWGGDRGKIPEISDSLIRSDR